MRRLLGSLVAGLLLALGAGCGGDEATPSAGPSSSSTSATSPATEATTASPTPTEAGTPSVAPATGLELVEQTSAVRVPAGWRKDEPLVKYASSASDPRTSDSVQLVDNVSIAGDDLSLDEMARIAMQSLVDDAEVTRLPDVDLAGTPAFRLQYKYPGDPLVYEMISAQHAGRSVGLDFLMEPRTLKKQPDLVDSVLATFRWL